LTKVRQSDRALDLGQGESTQIANSSVAISAARTSGCGVALASNTIDASTRMNASAGAPRLVTTGGRSKMLEDAAPQSGSFADTAFVIPFAALSAGPAGGGSSEASSTPALAAISATTKNSTMVFVRENRAGAGAPLSLADDACAGILAQGLRAT
jgi:hypothetical protein